MGGRRLIFAAVLAVTTGAAVTGGAARADWQVHRDGSSQALVAGAEQALEERPDDAALARRLVQLAGHRGAAAVRDRLRMRAVGATSYAPYAAYAQLLLALGDGPAAATAFAEALRLSPEAPGVLAGRARALQAAGSSEAIGAYDEAIRHEPRPPARRRLIEAELALLSGDQHGAGDARGADLERIVELHRELARLAPESDRDAEQLADALAQAGRPAEAAAALERRIPPHRQLAKLPLALRAARLRLADWDAADAARVAAGLRALLQEIPPGATESRRAAWACAREAARAEGTLGALGEALAKTPGLVEWDLLGQVREELGDLDGALNATRKAEALAPRDAELGRRLLGLLDWLGRDGEALEAAQTLARQHPSEVGFSIGLGERQWRRGDRAAAGATFDRTLVRFAREPTALETLAETATRWGDDRRALAAWTRLVHVDPTGEIAVVGLGEAQFQAGRHDEARRTWAAVRKRASSPAEGHLRLGELLFNHELVSEALEEARQAEGGDAKGARPHRLLAQIDERQQKLDAAVAEWRRVLTLAEGPHADGPGLRREARARLLALLARQGRGKLDAEVHRLRDEAAAHADDAEAAMFLAEAQQRLGDLTAAMATLRALAARGAGTADARAREAAVEAGFALARLLRQTGQLDEATTRLGDLARLSPDRMREAELQIADIALARYDLPSALAHAAAAEAGDGADAAQLTRVAEIQERSGVDALAVATYRKAIAHNATPTATLALTRLLERLGDATGAATAIEALLAGSRDDASISDAARRALGLDEALGRLPDLAEALASNPDGEKSTPARRRALVDVLERLLPALYRDPAADELRARLGRIALRPLLDLVIVTDVPDWKVIDLLGMLGNADAAPALARIAAQGGTVGGTPRGAAALAEARASALVALARLGDPRGLAPLAAAATAAAATTRAAGVWGLGRIAAGRIPRAWSRAWRRFSGTRLRIPSPRWWPMPALASAAAPTPGPWPRWRNWPAMPLGRARSAWRPRWHSDARVGGKRWRRSSSSSIAATKISRGATIALAWTRDPRALPVLLARALLPGAFALAGPDAPLAALRVWQAGGAPPDEARAVAGSDSRQLRCWRRCCRRHRRPWISRRSGARTAARLTPSWPTPSPAAGARASAPSRPSMRGSTVRGWARWPRRRGQPPRSRQPAPRARSPGLSPIRSPPRSTTRTAAAAQLRCA